MNPIYYLDIFLAIIVFFVITDENALPFFTLKYKFLLLAVRKQWLLLRMKPDMWLMKWRLKRVLKKLQADQELQALAREHTQMMNDRDSDTDLL